MAAFIIILNKIYKIIASASPVIPDTSSHLLDDDGNHLIDDDGNRLIDDTV